MLITSKYILEMNKYKFILKKKELQQFIVKKNF